MIKRLLIVAAAVASAPTAAQNTTTYQYDPLGRLSGSTVTKGGASVSTAITYDSAGNRKNYKVTGAPTGGSGEGDGSGNSDPGAGAATQPQRKFVVVPLNGFTLIPIS